MKKMFLLLLVALLGSQMIRAQVRACVTFDKTRSLEGFKQVILTWKDPFIRHELWPAYVDLVNNCLKKSKIQRVRDLIITSDIKGITFILNHSVEYENSYFNQSDYLNGVRINNQLQYRNIYGNSSNWVVFEYEDVNGMYAKIFCANPQQPIGKMDSEENFLPVAVRSPMPVSTSTPISKPESVKKDTVYVEREIQQDVSDRPERTNVNTYYINNYRPYGYYGLGYYYGLYLGQYCYRYYGGPDYHFTGGGYYNGYTGRNNQYIGNSNYTTNGYHFTGGNNRTSRNNQRTGNNYNFTGGNNRQTNYGGMSTGRGSVNTTPTVNNGNKGGGRNSVSSYSGSGNKISTSRSSFSSSASTFRSSATTRGGRR